MWFFRSWSFFAFLVVIALDITTKAVTQHFLPLVKPYHVWYPYGGLGVFQNFGGIEFSINHVINRGAAWGAFFDYQQELLYFRIVLITALFVYLLYYNTNIPSRIPLALILAGAVGNVIDYFLYGHVVDMLHFVLWGYDFPVFNIADSAIFIGICWMIGLALLEKKTVKAKSKQA